MPLHHIGGIVANIYAPLASGSGAVYINKFSAALVLNLDAVSPKVTWIYCVPSHLQAILSARTPDSKPPSCVRLYRSGAAALPVAPVAAPAAPTVPAEPASAPHEFQSRRASLKPVAPTREPPSPSPSPESEPVLRPSASSSSLEDQIAAGRRNLRKSPPPSPSPAHNTRKSVESYLAARWRAAATEPDPPLEDEAACPLDGGDLGPRLEAFESESIASSTDSSTAASSVERPRSLLSKARAVNGGTRPAEPAPEPAPAPEALEDSSSSDAESAEDPAVLAAAQTRLAASEAELAGLLEALAQTRRDVAETRRVVDDESKASVASSVGE